LPHLPGSDQDGPTLAGVKTSHRDTTISLGSVFARITKDEQRTDRDVRAWLAGKPATPFFFARPWWAFWVVGDPWLPPWPVGDDRM